MINFWIVGGALIIFALVLTLVPLFKGREQSGVAMSLAGLFIGLPVAVVSLYLIITTQDWKASPAATQTENSDGNIASSESVESMVAQLEERLKDGSGGVDEWLMLARSYISMQRFEEAAAAYTEAWNESNNSSVEAALGLGESLTYSNRDALRGDAGELVEWALAQEPENPRALWFGGLVSLARDKDQQAAERWTKLLRFEMPDQLRNVIQQQLAVLPAVASTQASQDTPVVKLSIDIKPELSDAAANGNALYIFVREPNKPGAPLAVKRLTAVLPTSVQLSDANVMLPGSTLVGKTDLVVTARISMSGDPIAAVGDLEGKAIWNSDSGVIGLVISTIRE
jgi:cytochrome c-type biogenesis protein CcmH